MSFIRQHQTRVLAAAAAKAAVAPLASAVAAAAGTHVAARLAQHLEAGGVAGPRATALAQVLLQLQEDRRRLKGLQSVEAKVKLKRDLVGKYDAWVAGILDASASTGQGIQDEVLATALMWRLDIGDYAAALPLAEYVLRFGLVLPDHIARQPAVYVAEEVAEAALRNLAANEPFPADVIDQVGRLTQSFDMPDQVRAKLHKAAGLELITRLDAIGESGVAGAKLHAASEALNHLRRALQLDDKVGVKKQIERLEREYSKLAATPPQDTPADDSQAG